MSFKKPFRAAPVKLGSHYRRKQRGRDQRSAIKVLGAAKRWLGWSAQARGLDKWTAAG